MLRFTQVVTPLPLARAAWIVDGMAAAKAEQGVAIAVMSVVKTVEEAEAVSDNAVDDLADPSEVGVLVVVDDGAFWYPATQVRFAAPKP